MRLLSPVILILILLLSALLLSLCKPEKKTSSSASAVPIETTQASQATVSEETKTETRKPSVKAWPQEASDIPVDSSVVYGNLENGMRYMIVPNEDPPNRLSLRLHIAAGSLMEAEDQLGLAHFIEHMVFNGTKNFKDANELIRKMQSLGIGFGAHVNAYTSFDETVYFLDLPEIKPEMIDLCFSVMRDFLDGALFSEEEIEAERGVILAEKASRDSVDYRLMLQQFQSLLPGSLIGNRFPIGEESVIRNAKRERFVDYYQKYYTPERSTFVIVGNVDTAQLQQKIESSFGSVQNPEKPGEEPNLGQLDLPEGIKTHLFTDPEVSETNVSINLVRPYSPTPDNKETRRSRLSLDMANFILSRRFEVLSKEQNSPIKEGSASKYSLFKAVEIGTISVSAADDRWKEIVPMIEQEWRRALEHGFTQDELAEAKAHFLNLYREEVNQKLSRKSDKLATEIARSLSDEFVYSTPETNLALAEEALVSLTPSVIHQSFVQFWEAKGYHLVLTTQNNQQDSKEILDQLYAESKLNLVTPPTPKALIPFSYTEFGKAGTIEKQELVKDLEITQLQLSNQIQVNLKKTDFQKNQIQWYLRIGEGQLSQPLKTPMLDLVAQAVMNKGGLGKHKQESLDRILAGRNVSTQFSVEEDAFVLSGTCSPEDQLLQLQLMLATISDPGFHPEALWQFQKEIPTMFQTLKHTLKGAAKQMDQWLHGEDFRYALANQEQLTNYTVEEVKKWLVPQLSKGAIEINIVGDFDEETLVKDLLTTFGSLPNRKPSDIKRESDSRFLPFPIPPSENTFFYESKISQCMAVGVWKTNGLRDNVLESRRLNILAEIYNDRIRESIREKLGASYSPNAGFTGSYALEGFSYLTAQAIGKVEDVPMLLETMEDLAEELANKGASQNELERSLNPLLNDLEKSRRDNSYWLMNVLAQSQIQADKLSLARNRDEDYRSIQLKDINQLARKYFTKSNLHKVQLMPKTK